LRGNVELARQRRCCSPFIRGISPSGGQGDYSPLLGEGLGERVVSQK